jgi:hypothetical protein
LGSKEFWELSKNVHSDDEEETFDPTRKKKNVQQIKVKKVKW